jgi:peptide/nickel transport system permease protein
METRERSERWSVDASASTSLIGRPKRQSGFWSRFRRRPTVLLGLTFMLALVLVALGADLIAPHDPFAISDVVLSPPSAAHLFGTDDLGRDVFSGVVHGARVSLLVGFVSALAATIIGIVIGGLAGYFGGFVDEGLMRLTEVFMVVPRFFLALIVVVLLGSDIWLIVLVLSLTYWPLTARVLRAQILTVRTRDYVQAARAVGTPELRILLRHVLPGALPPVITQASLLVGSAILVEAGLSFLGLGDPNVVSWGAMLNDAQQFVFEAWWMSVFPGLAITLTVLGVNLVADALTEAWDPRLASE